MMDGEGVVSTLSRNRGKGYCKERETEQSLSILYHRKSLHTKLMLSTRVDNAISFGLPECSHLKLEN